jgi:HTH-type transcriptional regulator, sugar sensing transcriptional regulator
MDEFVEKLQNIGLTERESRVYLYLLQHQESKAGSICSTLNIRSSHIYAILEKLLDKGIISYKIINKIKFFYPVDPKSLYALFGEKERQLEKEKEELKTFITSLEKIEVKEKKQNDFKYFEGISGVRSMFTEFIESWEKDSDVYVASAPLAYEKWNAFLLDMFHPIRKTNNNKLKLIVPSRLKKHGEERRKFEPIEIKYSNTETESEFGVAGDYIYFLSYGDKPYALLVKDKNLANTQIKIFQMMWENSIS